MSPPPWPQWLPTLSVWSRLRRDGYAPWALELVIVLSMMLLIAAATPIGAHLGSISPHPLWIPVLLLSSQYGTMAGVAAAVASMVVHWLAGAPPQAGGEDIYDYLYRTWREPMLWPVAAVVLGGFRAQHAQKTESLRARLIEADAQLRSIGELAEGLRAHCEALERHIACAADRSIEAGLAALEEVRKASPETLEPALARAMEMLVGPASYLLLTLRDGRLRVDGEISGALGGSSEEPRIERLPEALETELLRGQRLLSIRKSEAVGQLAGVGLIAAPILAPTGDRLIGALLVQSMDPMRLTEATEHNLCVLCHELSHALSRDRVLCSFVRQRTPARSVPLSMGAASPAR
jgi:polysaccharide biosynthesis protein PelD